MLCVREYPLLSVSLWLPPSATHPTTLPLTTPFLLPRLRPLSLALPLSTCGHYHHHHCVPRQQDDDSDAGDGEDQLRVRVKAALAVLGVTQVDGTPTNSPVTVTEEGADGAMANANALKKAAPVVAETVVAPLTRKTLMTLLRHIAGQVDELPESVLAMAPGYQEPVRGLGRATAAATAAGTGDTAGAAATFAMSAQGTNSSTWGGVAQVRLSAFVSASALLLPSASHATLLQRPHPPPASRPPLRLLNHPRTWLRSIRQCTSCTPTVHKACSGAL